MNDIAIFDPDWDYDEDKYMEPLPSGFCDGYEVHEAHAYRAINHNTYFCSGFSAADLARLEEEEAQPPCEHGMSASLCAGPNHYPADSYY